MNARALVIASHNEGKVREIADLLAPFSIDAVGGLLGRVGLVRADLKVVRKVDRQVAEAALKHAAALVFRVLFTLRVRGAEHVPATGPVLIAANRARGFPRRILRGCCCARGNASARYTPGPRYGTSRRPLP